LFNSNSVSSLTSWLLAGLTLTLSPAALAATPSETAACRQLSDDRQRLACYDQLFAAEPGAIMSKVQQTTAPAQALLPPAPDSRAFSTEPVLEVATILDKYWELTSAEKRDLYVFRSYQASFFLPLHYSSNINRQPQSPVKQPGPANDNYRQLESKLQISLRTKIASDLLWQHADLWFAFTQRSMWQLWNSQDSAPFRSTDYQPELIYVLPVAKRFGTLPGGWRVRMLQAGIAHQSNGQSDPLSRSWNKVSFGLALDKNEFGLNWRYHQRLPEKSADDDNPDLIDYIGSHELTATWLPGLATASLVWRNDFSHLSRGSWQLDMTYPFTSEKLDGLRWHLQLFSGYGETLLDYNQRQHSIGLGVMLFNF
jgi:phospholipase A1